FGITVYIAGHKGSASTSDTVREAVEATVRAACNIARFTETDPCNGLADADRMARAMPDLDLDHPWDVTPADAERIAREAEDAARGTDVRITNSDGAGVASHRSTTCYGNSHGFLGAVTGTRHSISCGVIASDASGMQRDHWYTVARDASRLERAAVVG